MIFFFFFFALLDNYSYFDISFTYFSVVKSRILVRSSVSVDQCRSPDAMVLFTVMDHDVLTANDFAGEAFLGLSTIPGVTDTNASIDNFHGLKHTELPLMHQKNRSKLDSFNFLKLGNRKRRNRNVIFVRGMVFVRLIDTLLNASVIFVSLEG